MVVLGGAVLMSQTPLDTNYPEIEGASKEEGDRVSGEGGAGEEEEVGAERACAPRPAVLGHRRLKM